MRGCTQCGECLAVCPVFRLLGREEYAPKAKRLLLEEALDVSETLPWSRVFRLSRLCAGCGRCRDACARKLSTPDLLAELRTRHPHWTQQAWELWIRRAGPLWPLAGKTAAHWPAELVPAALRASLASAAAMDRQPPIPWVWLSPTSASVDETSRPVLLFSGCTARNVRPRWTMTARALLERRGFTVLGDEAFTCCGTTLHHAGRKKALDEVRAANITAWQALGQPHVVTFCASCNHGLMEYAAVSNLFSPADATRWRMALRPLASLLGQPAAAFAPAVGGTADKARLPGTVGYHQPCHARQNDADGALLRGLFPDLRQGSGLCCGLGGILKMTDPKLSEQLGRACLEGFGNLEVGHQILTACGGCALQLAAVAPEGMQAWHWLDVVSVSG